MAYMYKVLRDHLRFVMFSTPNMNSKKKKRKKKKGLEDFVTSFVGSLDFRDGSNGFFLGRGITWGPARKVGSLRDPQKRSLSHPQPLIQGRGWVGWGGTREGVGGVGWYKGGGGWGGLVQGRGGWWVGTGGVGGLVQGRGWVGWAGQGNGLVHGRG